MFVNVIADHVVDQTVELIVYKLCKVKSSAVMLVPTEREMRLKKYDFASDLRALVASRYSQHVFLRSYVWDAAVPGVLSSRTKISIRPLPSRSVSWSPLSPCVRSAIVCRSANFVFVLCAMSRLGFCCDPDASLEFSRRSHNRTPLQLGYSPILPLPK